MQLRYYTVAAPTAGIVGDVPVRVGNQVTTQTVLTTIDQNETLEIHISVPIERAPALKNGLPINILSSDGATELATTKVGFISPHVDDQTQSLLVKGTVQNPGGRLRAQQYERARIIWKTTEGLVLPVTSVLRINGRFFAFVAEDSEGKLVAKQRPITVGAIVGDNYAADGIKPGERVVTAARKETPIQEAPVAALRIPNPESRIRVLMRPTRS